jgi:hypothetical protein
MDFELFRLDLNGRLKGVDLSAQYRWYSDFEAVHHAWIGFQVAEKWRAELGVTQVPFGILPYASHSFWFGGTYYLGQEDDYDMGVKFVRESEDWTLHAAFFKNPEYIDDSRAGRYSFDLITDGDQQNSEINQLNFRMERHLRHRKDWTTSLGLSLEGGQVYNETTEDTGGRGALALHLNGLYGPWNLQLQAIHYEYDPRNPDGVSDDTVQLGAFLFPFLAASEGRVYSANLAHKFTLGKKTLQSINLYNDFTYIDPAGRDQDRSIQNVTGFLIESGPVYTYVDWIFGRNMWFAGGPGIGLEDPDGGWDGRLNVNVGFYF